eukprot:SAG11_NODE_29436_length_310_cov_9.156398_1_plen_66_part_01
MRLVCSCRRCGWSARAAAAACLLVPPLRLVCSFVPLRLVCSCRRCGWSARAAAAAGLLVPPLRLVC